MVSSGLQVLSKIARPLKLNLSCSLSWLSHRRLQCIIPTFLFKLFPLYYYYYFIWRIRHRIWNVLGSVEGSWVIGFFRDADTKQDAVILGSLVTSGLVRQVFINAIEGLGFSVSMGFSLCIRVRCQ